MDKAESFSPGDVVELKSGGPPMTVIKIADAGAVWCQWFPSPDKVREKSFPSATLKRVDTWDET